MVVLVDCIPWGSSGLYHDPLMPLGGAWANVYARDTVRSAGQEPQFRLLDPQLMGAAPPLPSHTGPATFLLEGQRPRQ